MAAIALAVAAIAITPALAAGLGSGTHTLGANLAAVAPCDPDGFSVRQTLSGSSVSSITVSGIASACATGTLSVTLNNGATFTTASGTVPAGGGSMTLSLSPTVAITDHHTADVTITGP